MATTKSAAALAQAMWRNQGSVGWKFVRDKSEADWGPWGGIQLDLSKLPDVTKKGKFTITVNTCPPKTKSFTTIEKAILWSYDDVVDRDSLDYGYVLKGTGIKEGIDISDFAWE
jgi:hypothetical protein